MRRLHEVIRYVLQYVLFAAIAWSVPVVGMAAAEPDADSASSPPRKTGVLAWADGPEEATLIAGQEATYILRIQGAPDAGQELRVWRADAVWDARDPHACVGVFNKGKPLSHTEDEAVVVTPNDDGEVEFVVAAEADCGWLEDDRVRAIPLGYTVSGEDEEDARRVELPYVLKNASELPDEIALSVYAGGTRGQQLWTLRKQSAAPIAYRLTLETERSTTPLPDCLRIDWADNDAEAEGEPLTVHLGGEHREQTVRIVAHATRGCDAQQYTLPIRVERVETNDMRAPESTLRALHVEVKPSRSAGAWIAVILGLCVVIGTTVYMRKRTA